MASIEKRTANNGATTYRVLIRLKGHPVQSATFERLTDARRWAASTESAIREGRHFEVSESRKRTVSDLIRQYRADMLPRLESANTRQVHLDWWDQKLGRYLLADVRPALLIETRKELLDGERAPSTVNRYCSSLSAAFTWAVKELQWMGDNPFFKISNFDEPEGVIRFLSDEERAALLDACQAHSQDLYAIVVLALSTGARRNELLSLTWPDIDLKTGLLTFPKTKNG